MITTTSCSLCRTPPARLITGTRHRDHITPVLYVNSIGYPSDSVSSSKWHVWFASRCLIVGSVSACMITTDRFNQFTAARRL